MISPTLSAPRFEVTITEEAAAARAVQKPERNRHPAKLLPAGTGFVQIFGRSPGPFTIAWREVENGPRQRAMRSTWADAKSFAERKANELANRAAGVRQLTPAEAVLFLRALEALAPTGKPLDLACSELAEAVQILGGRASLAEACRYYIAQHPIGIENRRIPNIVEELLKKKPARAGAKGQDQTLSRKYHRVLSKQLERFAAQFQCPFTELRPRAIEDWLESLKKGLRTRRNHLHAVKLLANFAKRRGYVPQDWSVLDSVEDPEPPAAEVNLYAPDELVRLLNKAESYKAGTKLVPLIAVTAFAGVRHGEMNEEKVEHLDWADFDWEAKRIYVGRGPAKTGDDRTVDMPDNLVAWLTPYRRTSGKICTLKNTSNALCRLRTKAGIKGPKKNALRKSFISYKLALDRNEAAVADQAGNSPAIIRRNYKRTDTKLREAAQRWFNIHPTRADVLPLFAWAKAATA